MTGSETPETDEDPRIDAAEYALGLLSAPEAEAFEARLIHDPELRQDYAAWAEYFAALTDSIPPDAPPVQVWNQINAALTPEVPRSYWQQLHPLKYLLGGILAAGLAWAALTFGLIDSDTAPELRAEIAGASDLRVIALYSPSAGGLVVERAAGASPAGSVYELWLIADGASPMSLGVLPDDARSFVSLDADQVAVLGSALLAISQEPPGGSPGIVPTGPVVAVGQMVAL